MDAMILKIITTLRLPARIRSIYESHKEIWLYLISGTMAMAISIAVQYAMLFFLRTPVIVNTAVSWVCAASLAFALSKWQVFGSGAKGKKLLFEILAFFPSRLATLGLEIAFMSLTVDKLGQNEYLMKLAAQVFITILNYIASKLIFKTRKDDNP